MESNISADEALLAELLKHVPMKLDHSCRTVLSGVIIREVGRSSNHRRLWLRDAPPSRGMTSEGLVQNDRDALVAPASPGSAIPAPAPGGRCCGRQSPPAASRQGGRCCAGRRSPGAPWWP